MLKTYQRETKLFEHSQDTNREDLRIRKSNLILQWFHFALTWRHFAMDMQLLKKVFAYVL